MLGSSGRCSGSGRGGQAGAPTAPSQQPAGRSWWPPAIAPTQHHHQQQQQQQQQHGSRQQQQKKGKQKNKKQQQQRQLQQNRKKVEKKKQWRQRQRQRQQQRQQQQEQQQQEQEQRESAASRSSPRLAAGDRHSLLLLMRDPLHQQTKLGAVFSPAQQHRSLRFAQLAAAYLGQPVTLVLLECLRLQDGAWGRGTRLLVDCLVPFYEACLPLHLACSMFCCLCIAGQWEGARPAAHMPHN